MRRSNCAFCISHFAFLLAALTVRAATPAAPPAYQPPITPRATYNFNPGWKFIRQDVPGAEAVAFDDSPWAAVSLPHTWNDVDTYRGLISHPQGDVGLPSQGIAPPYRGIGWYRKHFKLPANAEGQKIFLEF